MDVRERLRKKLGELEKAPPKRRRKKVGFGPFFKGVVKKNDAGTYFLATKYFPIENHHGNMRLTRVLDIDGSLMNIIARADCFGKINLKKTFFFDVETTSLDIGAGVYVFLIGVGYFSGKNFVVRQYFMNNYHEEYAMLSAFNEFAAKFEYCVSFNGKAFDKTRIADRLAFYGLDLDIPREKHLDLVHIGRRIWNGCFEDNRLRTYERNILGFARIDDIPGEECPIAYFDHLRGDSERIEKVFEHNYYDVLSLAALLKRVEMTVAQPTFDGEYLNLSRFFLFSARRYQKALALADAVLKSGAPILETEALVLKAAALLRQRLFADALPVLEELSRIDRPTNEFPYMRLATIYSRRPHSDLDRAIETLSCGLQHLSDGHLNVPPGRVRRVADTFKQRIDRFRYRSSGPAEEQ